MTQAQKTAMNEAIVKHGINLNNIFNTGLSPYRLCSQLRAYERKAEIFTTDECNTGKKHEQQLNAILYKVKKLLKTDCDAIFINGDPRGYALKIKDSYVREHNLKIYTDWGGYGILAPDFTPNNQPC